MNRGAQILIGILSIVLSLAAGLYGRNTYLKEVSTYQVPIPVQAIPSYTVLTPELFQMREMPRAMETLPYFQTVEEMVGLISTSPIPADLPIAKTNAVSASLFRLADANFEVVSIPVKPVSAVGGQVQIGQRVNLYQLIEERPEGGKPISSSPEFTVEMIAGSVLVVDVRNSQGAQAGPSNRQGNQTVDDNEPAEQVQILTLALLPESVQSVLDAVAKAEKQGGLLWTTLARP